MKPSLVLMLAAGVASSPLPLPLAAQTLRARLAGRIPAAAIAPVDSLVRAAAADGLPTDQLVEKALEGGAKQASSEQIVAAVAQIASQLREARTLLLRSGAPAPLQPAEVVAVAAALVRGLPATLAQRIVAVLPGEPTGPALDAVADMVGHGFVQDSAVDLVVDAVRQGLRGLRLLDVATATVHELQRGRSHSLALADVRRQLPNVPTAPTPPPAAVTRARRPVTDTTHQ
ncbi:MAG TPA: hypothetical protein VEO73_14360 [Gemmatimonadales bacterium]|nr:hypothetical protein [Gemmatimonadales bacterium]